MLLLATAALAGAYLLFRKGANASPATKPKQSPTSDNGASSAAPSDKGNLLDTVATGGIVAAGMALAEANAQVSRAIGGTDLAEWTGRIGGFGGTGAVVGAEAGKEFNKALGGRDGDATHVIAQVTGGTIGYLATVGTIGLILAGPAGIFYLMFIPGIGQLGLLAFAIGAAISDAVRLGYGQQGALIDYKKEWAKLYGNTINHLEANGMTAKEAQRFAYPFTDGVMLMRNDNARIRWMKQPRGVGLNEAQHYTYGKDRGYFVENPPRLSDDVGYFQFIPAGDIETFTVPRMDWYEVPVKGALNVFDYFKRGTPPTTAQTKHYYHNATGALGSAFDEQKARADGYSGTRWEERQNGTETRYRDKYRFQIEALGSTTANVSAYVTWMTQQPYGFGQSDLSHLNYGRNEGHFQGDGLPDGKLAYAGNVYDFRTFAKKTA